ncbi:hypothetical protein Hanom_Chr14g01272721 [Helianthus anomalus]
MLYPSSPISFDRYRTAGTNCMLNSNTYGYTNGSFPFFAKFKRTETSFEAFSLRLTRRKLRGEPRRN